MRHLAAIGFAPAPHPLGRDDQGREVLTYLPGEDCGWPLRPFLLRDEGAQRLGRLARELQAALSSYRCPADAVWQTGAGPPAAGQTLQHGDLGPWHILWDGDEPVGIIDWDLAHPAEPWYDIAHLASPATPNGTGPGRCVPVLAGHERRRRQGQGSSKVGPFSALSTDPWSVHRSRNWGLDSQLRMAGFLPVCWRRFLIPWAGGGSGWHKSRGENDLGGAAATVPEPWASGAVEERGGDRGDEVGGGGAVEEGADRGVALVAEVLGEGVDVQRDVLADHLW